MSPWPRISVIIPNYNHARLVGAAIHGVLNQSPRPSEVIVIDDASTDDSLQVIRRHAARSNAVRLLCNQSNQGCFRSVARGLTEATGDYVYISAADERALPGFFTAAVTQLRQHPSAGCCVTGYRFVDANRRNTSKQPRHPHIHRCCFMPPSAVRARLLKQRWFLGGIAMVVFRRAALLEAGGIQHALGLLADWYAVHHVALKHGICYVPEPLVEFCILPGSLGTTMLRNPKEMIRYHALALEQMARHQSVFDPQFIQRTRRAFRYTIFRGAFVTSQEALLENLSALLPARTPFSEITLSLFRAAGKLQQLLLKTYCTTNFAPLLAPTKDSGN